jgi:hypothetical protein
VPALGQRQPLCDPLHQPREVLRTRGQQPNEAQAIITLPAIDPIKHEQVKVHVEIERAAESLYQGHGPGHRAGARQAGLGCLCLLSRGCCFGPLC